MMEVEKLINSLMANMLKLISVSPKLAIDRFFEIVYSRMGVGLVEYFFNKVFSLSSRMNNNTLYCHKTFKACYERAKHYGVNIKGAKVFELGAGKPIATGVFWKYAGADQYVSVDKYIDAKIDPVLIDNVRNLLEFNIESNSNFQFDELFIEKENQMIANDRHLKFVESDFLDYEFDNKFDYIYSNAVLEHVEDPMQTVLKLKEILSDDGVMVHGIDFQEHYRPGHTGFDRTKSIEFLKYSKEEWSNIEVDTYNINRLRFSDYKKLFEENGFEIIDTNTSKEFTFGEDIYDEIHEDFKDYKFEDLKIAVGVFVVKKSRKL